MPDKTVKKSKLFSLVKEINRSKEDVIDFLSDIGIEKVTLNTTLEPDIVAKVYAHFKKDIEEKEKHVKKVVDFVKVNRVEIFEAEQRIRKEAEEKKKKEEDDRLKKYLEEQQKKAEEEKRKQEFIAFVEREKAMKAEADEIAKNKEALDKLFEKKKKQKAQDTKQPEKSSKKEEQKPTQKSRAGARRHEHPRAKQPSLKHEHKKYTDKKSAEKEQKAKISGKQEDAVKGVKPAAADVKKDQGYKKYDKQAADKSGAAKSDVKEAEKHKHKKGRFEKVTIKDTRLLKKADKKSKELKQKEAGEKPETVSAEDKQKKPEVKDKKSRIDTEIDRKKRKHSKNQKVREFSQKEIDDAIRETFAKIGDESGASARSIARKRKKKERIEQEKIHQELKESRKNVIEVTEYLSTVELANLMSIEPTELIKKCFDLGMMVTINQRLEKDLIVLLAEEFGFKIEFQEEYKEDIIREEPVDPSKLKERPPVVTVMGHVDHGKTSLLDYVRKANVVAGEAGGITQHIGAYKVILDNNKEITFLDTPGHEAFTAMRARGGQAADIVVLVVAADDSVMPQTVEAINHALAAGVPIVIAINKIDKPESNINRIKQQLADKNILVEEWGGKYQSVEISAKFGKNIESLLDKILLEAEILELKANPDAAAKGVVLESRLDKGKGALATVLVQSGTLKIGDNFIAGIYSGRVRAMFDERDKRIEAATPSTPVQILGFEGLPQAGDIFIVMASDTEARAIALKRQQLKREQDFRQIRFTTLDDISDQIKQGKKVELNIILKADVDGSAEALEDSLHKLSTKEATVRVIHKAVGQITESDVLLAEASKAIIIGFNIRPNLNARKLAEKSHVDIRIHNIIYKVLDEMKHALEGMLEPEIKEEIMATVEIRQVFKVPKIGNVAGCYVQDGKIMRNHKVRLLRDGLEIYNGTISSLKRIKDDAREVESGYECGICLDSFGDIKVGDIIEAYQLTETKRKLATV